MILLNVRKVYNKSSYLPGIIAFTAVIPFYIWLYRYINLDFWYDEVYTLVHCAFVSIKTTITTYPEANNHILSNIVNNVYLKILGEKDLNTLMNHPWIIRFVQLIYTVITLTVFYRLCKKFLSVPVAIFSVILLTTSIPYYNFALQIRGYNLSILLLCCLLYYLWSYECENRRFDGLLLVVSVALFVYSVPSNIYSAFGIGLFYGFECIIYVLWEKRLRTAHLKKRRKTRPDPEEMMLRFKRNGVILSLLLIGVLFSFFLYVPVIHEMVSNPIFQSRGMFYKHTLHTMMPSVLYAFISWRYLVVFFAVIGLIRCAFFYKRCNRKLLRKTAFCFVVFLTPFLASFIRGDRPYDRNFLVLLPVFCLLLSLNISFLFDTFLRKKSKILYVTGILFLYTHITFAFGIKHINDRLMYDIKFRKVIEQTLLYNYYQSSYAPMKLMRFFSEKYFNSDIPLVVGYSDRAAIIAYINKFQFQIHNFYELDKIVNLTDSIFVISGIQSRITEEFHQKYPDFELRRLNDPIQFQNLYLLSKRND